MDTSHPPTVYESHMQPLTAHFQAHHMHAWHDETFLRRSRQDSYLGGTLAPFYGRPSLSQWLLLRVTILTPHNGPRFRFDPVPDIVPLVAENGDAPAAAVDNVVDCDFDSDAVVHCGIVGCDFDSDYVVDVGDVDAVDSAAIATAVAATAAIVAVAHSAVRVVQKHSA